MKLLDLFCCAGGAAVGYQRAGFTSVTGVDIAPQPHYPYKFIRADAIEYLAAHGHEYDAIHASPPCQVHSDLAKLHRSKGLAYDLRHKDFIPQTRALLQSIGTPYVIENVEGAPLIAPVILCGTMFNLRVIRHRLFECNFPVFQPDHVRPHPLVFTHDKRKRHYGKLDPYTAFVQVTGGGNCPIESAKKAMGIDWMNKKEMNEAIPPAYTEYIGKYLLQACYRKG